MAGFIYFVTSEAVKGRRVIDESVCREIGLSHICTGKGVGCVEHSAHPGGAGMIIVPERPSAPRLGFDASKQTWHKGKGWWVGWWTDAKPTPADLQRDRVRDGTELKIDDQIWTVPRIVAAPGRASTLPRAFAWDDEAGEIVLQPLPAYRELEETSRKFLRSLFAGESNDGAFTAQQQIDFAAATIVVNYHCSIVELALLGALSTESVEEILAAAIDFDQIVAHARASIPNDTPTAAPQADDN